MVKVLWKETTFPRCKATDSRLNMEPVSLVSWVTAVIITIIIIIIIINDIDIAQVTAQLRNDAAVQLTCDNQ